MAGVADSDAQKKVSKETAVRLVKSPAERNSRSSLGSLPSCNRSGAVAGSNATAAVADPTNGPGAERTDLIAHGSRYCASSHE